MRSTLCIALVIGALCPTVPGTLAGEATLPGKPVLVQTLSDRVLWTRRPDRYTLQILTKWRRVAASGGPVPKGHAKGKPELPAIEAWLLKKDGAAIPPIQRWQTPAASAYPVESREPRAEVLIAYALPEGSEAVAVVVCTDGDCLVRKISPFAD